MEYISVSYVVPKRGDILQRRKVPTQLIITCDVFIDEEVKRKAVEQYSSVNEDHEIAKQLLYAYLNPQLPLNDKLEQAEGAWDMRKMAHEKWEINEYSFCYINIQ